MNANLEVPNLLAEALKASETGDLLRAQRCLDRALQLAPDDLMVLLQAARFCYSVLRDSGKAEECAGRARQKAKALAEEMDEILGRRGPAITSKSTASRRIGGIIGPY